MFKLPKLINNQKGAIPVLILIAIVGLLGVLVVTNTASFKNSNFANLFPKKFSFAAVSCTVTVPTATTTIDGTGNYSTLKAGDVVCLQGGTKDGLKIVNVTGSSTLPITFVNSASQVVLTPGSNGLTVQGSRYIKIGGNGVDGMQYGIKMPLAKLNTSSSDFEVYNIEVTGSAGQGIIAKTPPTCTANRSNFVQLNSVFHDNYIHDVGNEAFYVGDSYWDGGPDGTHDTVVCNQVKYFAPELKGVQIYNNRIEHTGWDGLQVGSAVENCNIHDNTILDYANAYEPSQRSGIMNNPGDVCNVYNNTILGGSSKGIYLQGNGGNKVYNNVIVRPGAREPVGDTGGSGIVAADGNGISIMNNTIISPKGPGVHWSAPLGVTKNNVVINSGAGVAIDDSGPSVTNNFYAASASTVGFVNPNSDDYHLTAGATALINTGADLTSLGVTYDRDRVNRPQGTAFDIGAYEFSTTAPTPTASASATPTPTPTPTPVPTPTPTPVPTPTPIPTPTPSPTPTPDTTKPTVNITAPFNNGKVTHSTSVTIKANAADNVKVTKVIFSVNGTNKCTDTSSSYTCSWSVPSKVGVVYSLVAKAYDAAGNIGTSVTVKVTSK